jgi:hypothetical protein
LSKYKKVDKYFLNNNEIIFEDTENKKIPLYFKSCKQYPINGNITMIRCKASNNLLRGDYSLISDGQNVLIQPGKIIKFTVKDSIGGIFTQSFSRSFDTTEEPLISINFNILYYNSEIKPGDLFPYIVYLLGNKGISNRNRNLEEKYEYNISFPNCTVVSYSDEDKTAIGNISCYVPNYIPAGTYTKLQSDGFDVSPTSKINIVFTDDYNASKFDNLDNPEHKPKKSSSNSSSKILIIWIIIGLILLTTMIIISIVCISKRKGKDKNSVEIAKKNNAIGNKNTSSKERYNKLKIGFD